MNNFGSYIWLHPIQYKIYVHEASFHSFFYSYRPDAFPGFIINLGLTNSVHKVFFSSVQHVNLNRETNPCEKDQKYSFHHCVRTSLARRIGCKLPWDIWTSNIFKVCSQVKDLAFYDIIYRTFQIQNLNEIISYTDRS